MDYTNFNFSNIVEIYEGIGGTQDNCYGQMFEPVLIRVPAAALPR